MPQWQKPENALRRANELLEVGKKQDALDTLHDVIKARKHRTWTKVHELIMAKHLDLCVELRKPHLAKDGLFQYRNMCQQVNVKSLEDVVSAFLEQAERKADQARQASQGLVEDVAEDLDQAESPERLLLSAVSGEGAQDRADRAVLSPWLRFLWESYRQCLELLRNNVQVEQLYHKVAKQAFQFCLKYQRRAEFRKLCDNLRTHVNQLQKASHTHYAVKLSNPETLALHQETRLTQLDVAIQMELWQEAYKSAEDVHQLMQSAKRSAKAQTLASYYERLALIFWKAGNTLYHTAALFKLFQLHKDLKKSFSNEEATHLATRVLLATLSIRWSDQVHDLARHLEMEEAHLEHQRRLASLLSWPTPPTRQFLLKELQRVNVIGLALQPAQQLYQWLENEFSPLKLAPEIQRYLEAVKALDKIEYTQYIEALQQVAALKILKQISQVYRSISLKRFLSIVPFFDEYRLERLIVAAGKKAHMQVRIDHRTGSVEFGVGEAMTFGSNEDESVGGLASAQLDVPVVQTMPNEHIRQYLQEMYTVLQDAVGSVDKEAVQAVTEKLKNNSKYYEYHKNDHHKATLERKKRIEQYKEMLERIKTEQEEQVRLQEKKELEKRQREDQQRLAQENKERTEAQKRREQDELQRKVMQDRVARLNPNLRKFIKDLPEEEIQNLDADTLLQQQISHLEQEKRELAQKMKQQEKKWDYYVRAIHVVEIPLREAEYKERAAKDRQLWEEHEAERVQRDEEDHLAKLSNHERLARMETDAMVYLSKVRESRAAEMQRQMEAWKQTLEETRERRLKERKDERKEKRRQEWLQAKEEAERQKKEEEERKKREAEEGSRRGQLTGEDGDRRKRFGEGGDRRRMPPRDGEDGGEPRGSDADVWERAGPLEPEARNRGGPWRGQEQRGGPEPTGPGGGGGSWRERRQEAPQGPPPPPEARGPPTSDQQPWRRPGPPAGPPAGEDERAWERAGPLEPDSQQQNRGAWRGQEQRGGQEPAGGGSWRERRPEAPPQGPPPPEARGPPMAEQQQQWRRPQGPPAGPYPEEAWQRAGPLESDGQQNRGPWRGQERGGPEPEGQSRGPWRGQEQRGGPEPTGPGAGGGSWRDRGQEPAAGGGSWRDRGQEPTGGEARGGAWRDRRQEAPSQGPPPPEARGPPGEQQPWRRGGPPSGGPPGEAWERPGPPESDGQNRGAWRGQERRGGPEAAGGGSWRDRGQEPATGGGSWRDRRQEGPPPEARRPMDQQNQWRRGPPGQSAADSEQSWRK